MTKLAQTNHWHITDRQLCIIALASSPTLGTISPSAQLSSQQLLYTHCYIKDSKSTYARHLFLFFLLQRHAGRKPFSATVFDARLSQPWPFPFLIPAIHTHTV
jgi:hypothetical protein